MTSIQADGTARMLMTQRTGVPLSLESLPFGSIA
jgi:hypothetical protein